MRSLTIADRVISDDAPCYVIAEIGHNHGGSVETAKQMIRVAAECGCEAVKLQKRENATLYSERLLSQPYENENSYGLTYGLHRAALEFDSSAYQACRWAANQAHVTLFSTAFDEASADFLSAHATPAFKIASGGLTDERLIKHVASFMKPVILSTGGGSEADIDRAVNWFDCAWSNSRTAAISMQLALLHSTASYPLKPAEANLRCIGTLRQRYPELVIGFSSHSPGIAFSLIAYALGARIIEHHVTLDRASKGTDHAFSLEPKGLATLCDDLKKLHVALGDGVKQFYDSERAPIAKMRRRLTENGMRITGARDGDD